MAASPVSISVRVSARGGTGGEKGIDDGYGTPYEISAQRRRYRHHRLGTDFDGFSGETDVPDTAHMQHLADVMSHEGFTDEEIEKVFSKNVLRVFRECWK